MQKKDGRSIPRETLEYLRNQSIRLWKKDRSIEDIADFCGVHFTVVYKWIRIYKNNGFEGLKRKKARGAEPKLTKDETKKLIQLLKKSANDYGFEIPLWDCKKIKQLIKTEFKKEIHFSNVWRMLVRFGLSPQKPEKMAIERNQRKVNKWIREEWPKIEKHRRKWQAMLYFQDESSVSLVPVLGTTWAKKGETPKVRVTGNRGSIAVSSAISPAGRMVFRIEKENVNSKTFIDFLKQIMKNHKWRKIIVIIDNSPAHIAKAVKDFVEQNKDKIAVYYLPTYSPDLNPDEEVWKYLKNVKLKAHQARNSKEFTPLVRSKMQGIQRKPNLIKSFFIENILF